MLSLSLACRAYASTCRRRAPWCEIASMVFLAGCDRHRTSLNLFKMTVGLPETCLWQAGVA